MLQGRSVEKQLKHSHGHVLQICHHLQDKEVHHLSALPSTQHSTCHYFLLSKNHQKWSSTHKHPHGKYTKNIHITTRAFPLPGLAQPYTSCCSRLPSCWGRQHAAWPIAVPHYTLAEGWESCYCGKGHHPQRAPHQHAADPSASVTWWTWHSSSSLGPWCWWPSKNLISCSFKRK